MHQVLVLSGHFELLDRRISAEINSLAKAGYQVTLVSVPARIPAGHLLPSVKVVMPGLRSGRLTWRVRSLVPKFIQDAAYRMVRKVSLPPDPYHLSFFMNSTPSEHFDVIHCHDLDTLPAAVALKKRLGGTTRLVYDAHELYPHQWPAGPEHAFWEKTERQYIHDADAVITINPALAQTFSSEYGIPTPIVIYNSVEAYPGHQDSGGLDLQQHFRAAAKGRRVLFQGRITEGHNIVTAVRGFRGLGSRATLFVLGDGPLAPLITRECRRQQIQNVFSAASVDSTELRSLTSQADVGLIPYVDNGTLNQRFCTPNKLFEYIEAGLPVCCGDLPELRRIVRGGGIGEVYPMRTEAEFELAMTNFLDRLEAGQFSRTQLESARQEYSWVNQERKLLELYKAFGG